MHIRPLSKLATSSKVRGDGERKTAVYTQVHEDLSTTSTKQFADVVEFGKRSIAGVVSGTYYYYR
jgi:RPE1 domain-containing protein